MDLALIALICAGLVVSGILFYELQQQRIMLNSTRTMLNTLSDDGPETPELENAIIGYEVVIRLKDPLAVAARETPASKLVSGIAPNLVRKEVYRQVVQESEALLAKRDIEGLVSARLRLEPSP